MTITLISSYVSGVECIVSGYWTTLTYFEKYTSFVGIAVGQLEWLRNIQIRTRGHKCAHKHTHTHERTYTHAYNIRTQAHICGASIEVARVIHCGECVNVVNIYTLYDAHCRPTTCVYVYTE